MAKRATFHRMAFLAIAACMGGSAAHAQILEIAPDGGVTRYDGPAVVTESGVTPIAPRLQLRRVAPPARRGDLRPSIALAARAAALSPELVGAVASRESGMRADRVSAKGAVGAMQLMPATARALGVDPADTGQNVRGGAAYLAQMMRRYDGDLVKALAAYNAGPGAVDRYGGTPPYPETQAYVGAVLERLSQTVAPLPAAAPPR
jgi:soluble lytic murein transglycosylase-like protein